jgi:hypothetical protein
MASIKTEMTGATPRIVEKDGRWGVHDLILQTTSGTLYLGLIPMQGRELADLLTEAFGSSAEIQAELEADLRANGPC